VGAGNSKLRPHCKAIDSSDELGALALEVALCEVRREEFRRGWRVTAHRLIIAEDQRLEKRADDVSGKDARLGLMTPIAIRMQRYSVRGSG
jgi:hypothetical protein